jgi:hypothetical protein
MPGCFYRGIGLGGQTEKGRGNGILQMQKNHSRAPVWLPEPGHIQEGLTNMHLVWGTNNILFALGQL